MRGDGDRGGCQKTRGNGQLECSERFEQILRRVFRLVVDRALRNCPRAVTKAKCQYTQSNQSGFLLHLLSYIREDDYRRIKVFETLSGIKVFEKR